MSSNKYEMPENVETKDTLFINTLINVKKNMENVGLNLNTIHIVIKYVMEATEKTPLKGKEQKVFALRIIKELIENVPDSNEHKKTLLAMYENDSISNTIELIVSASKGELGINNITQIGSCLWSCIKANIN